MCGHLSLFSPSCFYFVIINSSSVVTMPRTEAQVDSADDQALASFASDVEGFKTNDDSRLRKLTKACLSSRSFVSKTRAAFEAEQQDDPTSFDGSRELGQWPTTGKAAVFRDPKDGKARALVEYVSKAVVELSDVAGMDWRPLKTSDLKKPVVDSAANELANQANCELVQELNTKYTGKVYKCAFCSKTAMTPSRWRIRQHMARCPESNEPNAEPIQVTTAEWKILDKFRVPGTRDEQATARRMRNQRYYNKKKTAPASS